MNMDQMQTNREALIRRDILRAANSARAAGGVKGSLLMTLLGSSATGGPDDDQHLLALCVDLINAACLTTVDLRHRTSERRTLDNTVYVITAMGTAVLAGSVRHPLVFDDRLPPRK